MIETVNKAWGWTGAVATELFSVNNFGNIIFKSDEGKFWRIYPEELECKVIAGDRTELNELLENEDFLEDWEMYELTEAARKEVGELEKGEKYCLKLPVVLGGLYDASNFGKISHEALISFSGQMAFRIKDLPDGEKFRILFD